MAYSYILVLAILFLSVLDCESCKDKKDPKLLKWKGKHPKFQFTISGKECQKWSEDTPHKKVYSPKDKDHNYCRNPDKNYSGLWCYTTTHYNFCQGSCNSYDLCPLDCKLFCEGYPQTTSGTPFHLS